MKIIYTSDNKICFKEDDYISHSIKDYMESSCLIVWIKGFSEAQEFNYSSKDAKKYSQEIIEQLKDK